jgi:DNA modification methylase
MAVSSLLYLGDCLELMKKIPDESVDLTVTSPPYDNLRSYNGQEAFTFEKFQQIALELFRLTKKGGIVIWVVGDATINGNETGSSFKQALFLKSIGFNLADTMIYQKNDGYYPKHNHRKYPCSFEYMFVLSKGKIKTFNMIKDKPNKTAGASMTGTVREKDGSVKPKHKSKQQVQHFGARPNVWGYSVGFGKSSSDKIAFQHPAIFPEKLVEDHIISWSDQGNVVLDPFMGSGTTGKMAANLNRNFIGIEKERKYFEIAVDRITKAKPETVVEFFE